MFPRSLMRGAVWGVAATAVMTVLMLIATRAGVAPMPAPVPLALAQLVLGDEVPKAALAASGMLAHFLYGALAGMLFVRASPRLDMTFALVFAALLWFVMQVVVLPLLGWGVFGIAVDGRIAVATLVLHLAYGAVLAQVGRGVTQGAEDAAVVRTAP